MKRLGSTVTQPHGQIPGPGERQKGRGHTRKEGGGVQPGAVVLDEPIFQLPLLNVILEFSSSESLTKQLHPNFLKS